MVGGVVQCGCGVSANERQSKSEANSGRTFFGCGRYGAPNACNVSVIVVMQLLF